MPPSLAPSARAPHEFEIVRDGCGHWVVHDRDGLVGGVFRRREDAIRFALFEADGDASCLHLVTEEMAK
jgi:hypothetical protein